MKMNTEIFGIDIGGTGIKSAPVDIDTGTMLNEPLRMPTPNPSSLSNLLSNIKKIIKHFTWQSDIGCGFPGVIKNGTIHTAANLPEELPGKNFAHEIRKLSSS